MKSHNTVAPESLKPSFIQTTRLTVLLEYFDFKCMFFYSNVCSIRVFYHNFVLCEWWATLIRTNLLIYLNTFLMKVVQRCSDNGGPTVALLNHSLSVCKDTDPKKCKSSSMMIINNFLSLNSWIFHFYCNKNYNNIN